MYKSQPGVLWGTMLKLCFYRLFCPFHEEARPLMRHHNDDHLGSVRLRASTPAPPSDASRPHPTSTPAPTPTAFLFDSDAESDFAFSDDQHESDSDSDREQKLTLVNIEGLSIKLDTQKEEERAAAEAEFLESELRTNIEPVSEVLEGRHDNLTPDLQLLRQRITDTVRILDDFTNLAESGRSRSEYVAQALKDI
ncbi:hypothetical protein CHU98_g12357 [Xylaria longipes]|nr:hypothetical protein CHU98_g12357 [Xylaria longipes]